MSREETIGSIKAEIGADMSPLEASIGELTAVLKEVTSAIKSSLSGIQPGINDITQEVKRSVGGISNASKGTADELKKVSTNNRGFTSSISGVFSSVKKGVEGAVTPIKAAGEHIKSAFGGILQTGANLTLAAQGAFGLMNLADGAIEAGDNVYILSQKLHMSTDEATQMNRVLGITDTQVKPFASTMSRLGNAVETAGKKGNPTTKALKEFGVSLTDAHGKLLPMVDQLQALSDGYNKAVESGNDMAFSDQLLGARAQALIPLFEQYSEARALAAKVQGIGIDPEEAKKASDEMKILKMEMQNIGNVLGASLMPVIEAVAPAIMNTAKGIAKFFSDNKQVIAGFASTVIKVASIIMNLVGVAFGALTKVGIDLYNNWDKVEATAQNLEDKLNNLKKELIDLKDNAFNKVKDITKDVKDEFENFIGFLDKNSNVIKSISTVLTVFFAPALIKSGVEATIAGTKIAIGFINNLVKCGIEAVIAGTKITINFIGSIIKSGAEAIVSGIKIVTGFIIALIQAGLQAILYGILGWQTVFAIIAQTSAWIAQNTIMAASAVWYGIITAAQWALNVAMSANPIALIIIGVAALVAAFAILWNKSAGFRDFFIGLWTDIWGGIKPIMNYIIGGINGLIGALDGIKFDVPSWVPVIGGKGFSLNIPKIPMLDSGGIITSPTLAMIGERRPEAVIPLDDLKNTSKGGGAPVFNFYNSVIQSQQQAEQLMNAAYRKLRYQGVGVE